MTTKKTTSDRVTRLLRIGEVSELGLRQPHLRPLDAEKLRGELVALHRQGHPPQIVLSLRGIEVFSGSCVGTLAEVAESLSRLGGSLVLRDVPPDVARMLKRSGLSKHLRLARSESHAKKLALGRRKGVPHAA
ncbi:MAG: STAS domain-containing protein [Phycisphaerales bacterium]